MLRPRRWGLLRVLPPVAMGVAAGFVLRLHVRRVAGIAGFLAGAAALALAMTIDAASQVNPTDARHAALVKTGSLAGSTGSNEAPASEPVNRVKADNGLDWGSAAIGAGVVSAVMLLGAAGTIGTRLSRVHPAS